MSTARVRGVRSSEDPLHPTRQQLDELDALLQRMLALPVHQVEEGAASEDDPDARAEVAGRKELAQPAQPEAPPERFQAPSARPSRAGAQGARAWEAPAERSWSAPAYPASYMVVENVVPPPELPPEAGPEASLGPRVPKGAGREELPVPAPRDNALTEMPADQPTPVSAEEWVPLRSSWQPSPHTWGPLADTWQHARPQNELQEFDRGPAAEPGPSPVGPRQVPLPPTSSQPQLREEVPAVAPPPQGASQQPARPEAGLSQSSSLGALWDALAHSPTPGASPGRSSQGPPPQDARAPLGPLSVPAPAVSTSWGALPLVAFNRAFDLALMPWGHGGRWLQGPTGRNVLGSVGVLCLAAAAVLAVADGLGWTW